MDHFVGSNGAIRLFSKYEEGIEMTESVVSGREAADMCTDCEET